MEVLLIMLSYESHLTTNSGYIYKFMHADGLCTLIQIINITKGILKVQPSGSFWALGWLDQEGAEIFQWS
jgi:hypothetical protein